MSGAPTKSAAIAGRSYSKHDALARGLGYFSIGLGLAELVAPRLLSRATGVKDSEHIIRAFGVREVATGLAILASHDPTPWIWGRVGGDLIDIATAASALDGKNPKRENVALTLLALAATTAADIACAIGLTAQKQIATDAVADYSKRSGFPRAPRFMRGAARDLEVPTDMRIPELLRPYDEGTPKPKGRALGAKGLRP
ncbi:cyclase dehydrase [Beijerinckia sp. L45]|uniref:cyclase dehydrase n=1 Tax=Beijerinckia sp. L45 TaxID=1641855 RepID=UPI00131E66C5|nr:cyclase dehydrase [Beijerinckia sp. L45]